MLLRRKKEKRKGRGNCFAAVPTSLVLQQSSISRRSRSRIFLGPAYEMGSKAGSAAVLIKKKEKNGKG